MSALLVVPNCCKQRLLGLLLFTVLVFFQQLLLAQCVASGDPVVNITFGKGKPDFGHGSTTFRISEGGMGPGSYTIVANSHHAHGGWHRFLDHTGDAEGMMALFDAAEEPGEFYRIRVSNVCPNTLFSFSAWVINANQMDECDLNPGPVNVRFLIQDLSGNIISPEYSTGDIVATPSPVWRPYGFEFDTGNNTEFDLVLLNNNDGHCGNDLGIDDIQFRACGPTTDMIVSGGDRQADTLFFCPAEKKDVMLDGRIADTYSGSAYYLWQRRQIDSQQWEDLDGSHGLSLPPEQVKSGYWYRFTAAEDDKAILNLQCRFMSDSIRLAEYGNTLFQPVVHQDRVCEGQYTRLVSNVILTGNSYGHIVSSGWQQLIEQEWQDLFVAGDGYVPNTEQPSIRSFRRIVVNACGNVFVTDTYQLEIVELTKLSLSLPKQAICLQEGPLELTGGVLTPLRDDVHVTYRGRGVSNGIFYPLLAGVGQHEITFEIVGSSFCTQASAKATITVLDSLYIEPMAEQTIWIGDEVMLAPHTNAHIFTWSGGPGLDNYHIRTPKAVPLETTTYRLTAYDLNGCEKTIDVHVNVLTDLRIPNAFSPNDDGKNDVWHIEGLSLFSGVVVQVYDRWGRLVYSSNGSGGSWDGRSRGQELPVGTYYYFITTSFHDKPMRGSVLLLK